MRIHHSVGVLAIVLATSTGCYPVPEWQDYYENQQNPTISGLSVASEIGNAGGQTTVIEGSGFGTDINDVLVLIGNHNARIVSVTDSAIEVVTPTGPLTGGAVNVLVATGRGFTELEGGYTYDRAAAVGASSDLYEGQNNFILVQNLWSSCYGGRSPDSVPGAGCEGVAYIGQSGIDGLGEFFEFVYPRLQTSNVGFVGSADLNADWHVSAPYDMIFPSGIEGLRRSVGPFKLKNEAFAGEIQCIDTTGANPREVACAEGIPTYDLGELQFCERRDIETGPTGQYAADWAALHNFFQGEGGDYSPVSVDLEWGTPEAPRPTVRLDLPGAMRVTASQGFEDEVAWALTPMNACFDGDGDGESLLDEAGVTLNWDPIDTSTAIGGACASGSDCEVTAGTYVHVSVTRLNMGWFGGEGPGVRASIVVPDGEGSVDIPNSVLYQFPTPNQEWSGSNQLTGKGFLGTAESEASFLLIEAFRVTDYRIVTNPGAANEEVTVFSYVTGDMSFPAYTNPTQATNDCGDCLDGDGDGWSDALDPDCRTPANGGNGVTEDRATTDFTCNDGLDNDNDGLIDAADEDCPNGWAGETNCGNGKDDDGDGWADALDGECDGSPFATESGEDDPSWTCSDGLDNDGDGWADSEDPGCVDGSGSEDDGFDLSLACNDGLDNDGDGFSDRDDSFCAIKGARAATEAPTLLSQCVDGNDNDTDGFVDFNDPDCDYAPHTRESAKFQDGTDPTKPWFGFVTECYDGLDNDGDGKADAADPNCWDPAQGFLASGWMGSESTPRAYPEGHANEGEVVGCTDGTDNDGDGWLDGKDPDCKAGTSFEETGFGTTVCNDGIDNNNDGKTDSESPYCKDGNGTFEG